LKSDLRPNGDCDDEHPLRDERTGECLAPGESPCGGDQGDGEKRRWKREQDDVREEVSHVCVGAR
jgi:hypothetical protein